MRTANRVVSVDVVRGAVMVLMAIDHVRVFSGIPAGGPTFGVFFTRWITHFCAPAFVFLAGTSAYLYAKKVADSGGNAAGELSRFLVTRGLWLIVLELTVLHFTWTFNFAHSAELMAGVIWMLGWCMILMALFVRLPLKVTAAFGILVIVLHNAVGPRLPDLIPILKSSWLGLWKILYLGFFMGPLQFGGEGGPTLIVLYSLIPWIGVMAAGYAFGQVLTLEKSRRDRLCIMIGLGATALFVLLRAFDIYGDPRPWRGSPAPGFYKVLVFLNTTKYPASPSFLLMTLGPTIALMPLLERARGRLADVISTFGRVPFLFYVLHLPLIHALALLTSLVLHGSVSPWLFANHPMGNPPAPEGYTWGLGTLYLVWLLAVVLLYWPCRRFAELKTQRKDWWLRYL